MGLALKKPKDVPGRSWPAIVIGFFVAFGGILFGWVVIMKDMERETQS